MSSRFQAVRNIWKLAVLVLLLLLTFSYAMFQGGFVSWFLFYSFLPFALYALFLAFYPLGKFSVERHFPQRKFHANESLTVKVTCKRTSFFPLLLLIVEEQLSEKLAGAVAKKEHKIILYPGFRREFSFVYEIEQLPRGEHEFSGIRMITSDMLGFVQKEVQLMKKEKVLVYPAYGEWSYKSLANKYEQGALAVNERMQRDATMAVGVRQYQPGDKLSWINWKASAKRGEILMKEFEQRKSEDLLLLLDCSPHPLFELLVQYTASIGTTALRKGARVGFMSISEERTMLPLQGGENQQQLLLYHLAKSKDKCPVSLAQLLKTDRFLLGQKAELLLITAQVSAELLAAVQMYTSRKCHVTIFVIKNAEGQISASESSLKETARIEGINVQFLFGPPALSRRKKGVGA